MIYKTMKKSFKLAAIAVAAIALMTACNNAPEPAEDTTAVDTPEVIDTPAVDTVAVDTVAVVEETPAQTKKPAKKTNKQGAVTKVETEGGRTIGKINTTKEEGTTQEKAIKNGAFKRN